MASRGGRGSGNILLTLGIRPKQITLFVKPNRPSVYLGWWDESAEKYRRCAVRPPYPTSRPDRRDADAWRRLEELVAVVYQKVVSGEDPTPMLVGGIAQAAAVGPREPTGASPTNRARGLTLRECVEKAFPPISSDGTVDGVHAGHPARAREARALALRGCDLAMRHFEREARPADFTAGDWMDIGRRFLRAAQDRYGRVRDPEAPGLRTAQRGVSVLLRAVSYCTENGWLDVDTAAPTKGWQDKLAAEFTRTTNLPATGTAERFSLADVGRLLRACRERLPDLDPRLALLLELGSELRLEALLRVRRSQLNLRPVGAFGLGRLVVPGIGLKQGVTLDLTPEERAAVDYALSTYLAPLERAFSAGEITDYPLAPAGAIPQSGVPATPRRCAAHWGDRDASLKFTQLLQSAGISKTRGLAWRGLRRCLSDEVDRVTEDETVRQYIGSWALLGVRNKKYRNAQDPRLWAATAVVRRRYREAAVRAADEVAHAALPAS